MSNWDDSEPLKVRFEKPLIIQLLPGTLITMTPRQMHREVAVSHADGRRNMHSTKVPLILSDQEATRDGVRLTPVALQLHPQWQNCLSPHFLIRIRVRLELIESLIRDKGNAGSPVQVADLHNSQP